jgi:hypothetical protein
LAFSVQRSAFSCFQIKGGVRSVEDGVKPIG